MLESNIIRSDDLRSENRRRVLKILRREGPCTSSQLHEFTGLSAASISSLTTQMIDQGILVKRPYRQENEAISRGRPQAQIDLDSNAGFIVTLNITIDHIRSQCLDYRGEVHKSKDRILDTRSLNEPELISACLGAIDAIYPPRPAAVHHIGVSFQGITEHGSGNLVWSPIIVQRNIPLRELIEERYGTTVGVNNDCRLLSEALSTQSAIKLGDSFATVFFSHGVGLGLYLGGQPFTGTRTSALELGHLPFERDGALCRCGRNGCIEAYAADYGIERLARGQSIQEQPAGRVAKHRMQELCTSANQGDVAAKQAFAIAGAAIGEGLATLFTLLDPMPVAMVGRSAEELNLMREGIDSVFGGSNLDGLDIGKLLHCVDEVEPILERGLIQNSLIEVDRLFAAAVNNNTINPACA